MAEKAERTEGVIGVARQASSPATTPASGAPQSDAGQSISAATLLAVEGKVRQAREETELLHLIANELRKLVAARQAIVLRVVSREKPTVACISSIVLTDKETPFVRWIESIVARVLAEQGSAQPVVFELPAFTDADLAETRTYPFRHVVWQPMHLATGELFAGILLTRERPWSEQDRRLTAREAQVFAGAWQALYGAKVMRPRRRSTTKARLWIAAAAVAAALLPVPLTALAPVEIVAATPQRVTAPLDGVIKEILVEPNRPVTAGQPLLRFEETTLRNRLLVAEQEMLVAKARVDRASQAAFSDEKARHDLAMARAEHDLKKVERDYAADLLARSVIVAERDGVLIYSDRDRWTGRPVKTGERIMQIVTTGDVLARIELPVADAIVLENGAGVRLFLDADPLSAVRARLIGTGYQAEPNSTQQLVYRLHAAPTEESPGLRIGARGTAQLHGSLVPLSFYLLRRPISAVRQYTGL